MIIDNPAKNQVQEKSGSQDMAKNVSAGMPGHAWFFKKKSKILIFFQKIFFAQFSKLSHSEHKKAK